MYDLGQLQQLKPLQDALTHAEKDLEFSLELLSLMIKEGEEKKLCHGSEANAFFIKTRRGFSRSFGYLH